MTGPSVDHRLLWVDSTQRPARLGCRKAVVDAMFLRRQSMKAKSELLA
jgi:hypothetical protein